MSHLPTVRQHYIIQLNYTLIQRDIIIQLYYYTVMLYSNLRYTFIQRLYAIVPMRIRLLTYHQLVFGTRSDITLLFLCDNGAKGPWSHLGEIL